MGGKSEFTTESPLFTRGGGSDKLKLRVEVVAGVKTACCVYPVAIHFWHDNDTTSLGKQSGRSSSEIIAGGATAQNRDATSS